MEIETLKPLVNEGLSLRQIAERLNCSQSNIRYWMKKHGLKTYRQPHGKLPTVGRKNRPFRCSCGESDPGNFYGYKSDVCKKCWNKYRYELETNRRLEAVEFLGGSCVRCGYNKSTYALDFHHLDPDDKDPNFKLHRGWGKERYWAEIRKCVLLCKNCHAETHADWRKQERGVA